MAEVTDFLPGGGMVNIGNDKEPWKEIHAEQINANKLKENGVALKETYFPKSGGELSGNTIRRNVNDSYFQINGASQASKGAFVCLYGSERSENAGEFRLTARKVDSDTEVAATLAGYPNAELKWNSNDLAGSAIVAKSLGANGYVKYASGLIIQWGKTQTDRAYFAFPIGFSSPNRTVTAMVVPDGSNEFGVAVTEMGGLQNDRWGTGLMAHNISTHQAVIKTARWLAIGY